MFIVKNKNKKHFLSTELKKRFELLNVARQKCDGAATHTRARAQARTFPPAPRSRAPFTGTLMCDSGGWPWPRGTQPLRFAIARQVPHAPFPPPTRLAFFPLSFCNSVILSLSLPTTLPYYSLGRLGPTRGSKRKKEEEEGGERCGKKRAAGRETCFRGER